MTDTMRWRYGDTHPVVTKPIAAGIAIEIGDLVEQDSSGNVTPANLHTWNTDLPTTQGEFHANFLGVAMQRSRSADTAPIRVATSGVFEMACSAATFQIGDLVGPAKDSGNLLLNQTVAAVGTGNESKAIARVTNYVNPANTQLLVSIVSTKQFGGPQAKA